MILVVEGAGGMLAKAPVLPGVTLRNVVVVEEEGESEMLTRDKFKVGRGCSFSKGRRYLTEQVFVCLGEVCWRHTSTFVNAAIYAFELRYSWSSSGALRSF